MDDTGVRALIAATWGLRWREATGVKAWGRPARVPRRLQDEARDWILHDPLAEMMADALGYDIELRRRVVREMIAQEARADAGTGRTGYAVSDGRTLPLA